MKMRNTLDKIVMSICFVASLTFFGYACSGDEVICKNNQDKGLSLTSVKLVDQGYRKGYDIRSTRPIQYCNFNNSGFKGESTNKLVEESFDGCVYQYYDNWDAGDVNIRMVKGDNLEVTCYDKDNNPTQSLPTIVQ